ncbi:MULTISPECIES: sodium/glutamate symporter [Thermomonas]|jgi:ESS family glutamate:Na+ symporter|uniref:Sodium/glutamate symporter n=3 Tax=Thermomonas TaxID=141948 RepID=A0ABS7TAX3_9GAMM|nr:MULTISPECIES: sodium/glutamate symporter [Thermomonas]MBS0459134.1 sodium/glutamate symporter [Pseudomonadota bacterium]MDE2380842.1 sodium/glutamate symporter [Xanthomonadaceae bacterium]MBZ4184994.1 sodium/glutamate symporter [Thermomonas beijingensis]HOC10358.1 sodium/glutamate symporter [Thermomonas sp.]HQA01659.1 sodium/glutamate symporter [Thermomonas sp.]
MLELNAVHTLALAGIALFLGYALCRVIPLLSRYNLPPPVIGGLVFALIAWAAHARGTTWVALDTSLQPALMIAFFTSIGFNASARLLKISGRQVALFLLLASGFAVLQNLLGMAVAIGFGLHPLFGVLAGSTTLTGGPATGLAFAPLFERAGVSGAASIAVASAMAGIVCGGLLGGPVATWFIRRNGLTSVRPSDHHAPDEAVAVEVATESQREYTALKSIVILLVAMWLGAWVSKLITSTGVTLPAYVGAMLAGALLRNLDDSRGWLGLSVATLELIGNVCLSLFLAVALMNLKLWELAGLAAPLLLNLALQSALVAVFCGVVFRVMGRDYDAAVMGGGFIGFMLGTTANAMAVMRTLVERYGVAPRAFLVAPLVGAFFIDFTNALIITGFINFWPH